MISLDAETTSNIAAGRYVYDLILKDYSSNNVSRLLEGIVNVLPKVTVI